MRAATRPGQNRRGTRAGTSTRSRATAASARTCASGSYPQLGVCWYTALVCGPDRATVAAIDFAAPLPMGEQLEVQTDSLRAEHRCEQPLQRFSLTLDGVGEAQDDPAALLRGEDGASWLDLAGADVEHGRRALLLSPGHAL